MKTGLRIVALVTLAIAGCSSAPKAVPQPKQTQPAQPAALGASAPFYLYRGVRTLAGTSNVDWTRMSFGVSGFPSGLTLFNSAYAAGQTSYPCIVRVTITRSASGPAIPGETALLQAPNPSAVSAGNPGPWSVIFDNNPAGHWLLPKSAIVAQSESNNMAGAVAAATFHQMVETGVVTVLNGTLVNCQP
jgi:hypothetical protein